MGCSICLDAFGEDNERGTRPVALPCGHIFHKGCSDGWLKACRTKGDEACCPLCKKLLGSERALGLWPSDMNDIDIYLQHRNQRMEAQRNPIGKIPPGSAALDRYMSRDAQSALLGKLLDFRQHISAYVLGVNSVNMSTSLGERQYRLFKSTVESSSANDEFRQAISALTRATEMMNSSVETAESSRREAEEKLQKARHSLEQITAMKQAHEKHMETKAAHDQRMAIEAERSAKLVRHHQKELQNLEQKRKDFEKERAAFVNEAREKDKDAMRARLESAQHMAQTRGDAEAKVNELQQYVTEQERLRLVAEDRAREAKGKSNWLADRIKTLSHKLDSTREENTRLKAQLASAQGKGARKGKAKAEDGTAPTVSLSDTSLNSPVESDGLKNEPLFDDDAEGSASGSTSSFDLEGAAETINQLRKDVKAPKREGSAWPIESQRDAIVIEPDDLDAELDDNDYPMPAFSRTFSAPSTRESSRPAGVMLPGAASRKGRESRDDDDVQFLKVKRPRTNGIGLRDPYRSVTASRPFTGGVSGLSAMLPSNSHVVDQMIGAHNTRSSLWKAPAQRRR